MTPARTAAVRKAVWRFATTVDRPLPWREERDPYRVLVSEVMLQQTQAVRVAGAYVAFCARFPTVEALAAAGVADVLRAWGSLGYNRRAVNLHRAARAVVDRGAFPRSAEDLRRLPGVGPYTARAVAAFAFGAAEAPVDANVRRVLSRVEGLPAHADVQPLADRLLPAARAAAWTQALFDLGALVCLPRTPQCHRCELKGTCAWAAGVRPPSPHAPPSLPFPQTRRYVRGRIVDALRRAPRGLRPATIARRTGVEVGRVEEAVRTLERDGLVRTTGRLIRLGGVDQRARSRSSSTFGTR